jgi:hypothetical protein
MPVDVISAFNVGDRVRVTYVGTVEIGIVSHTNVVRSDAGNLRSVRDAESVELIARNYVPGTILRADGILWVVRRSALHVPYRVMPVDLSGERKTLPIDEWFTEYGDNHEVLYDAS